MRSKSPEGRRLVLTVNYNSADLIARLVNSFPEREYDHWLIVDSHSSRPDEVSKLQSLASEKIEILMLPVNVGFGAAINTGFNCLNANSADYVFILNPDTTVLGDTYTKLLEELHRVPRAIVSARILDSSEARRVWFEVGHVDLGGFRTRHVAAETSAIASIPFVPGTAFVVKAELWRNVGGYRSDLFMYWEDVDLALRAHEQGIPMRTASEAVVMHAEGGSSRSDSGRSELYYYYVNRNRMIVARSYHQRHGGLAIGRFILVSLGMLTTPLRQERDHVGRKFLAAVRGLKDGCFGTHHHNGLPSDAIYADSRAASSSPYTEAAATALGMEMS